MKRIFVAIAILAVGFVGGWFAGQKFQGPQVFVLDEPPAGRYVLQVHPDTATRFDSATGKVDVLVPATHPRNSSGMPMWVSIGE